jgi:F-type H+-transporting ATPase subunit delta
VSVALPRKELASTLLAIIDKQPDKALASRQIAAYLLQTGRVKELDLLVRDMEKQQLDKHGILEITASSAFELPERTKAAIESLFSAKKNVLHVHKDATLIGGVRVRAQDQVLDLSVRTRLQRLKNSVKV